MDLLIITLIMMACLQLFMNIRKSRKIGHIGELSGVNELMDYIDHNELTLTNDMGKNALMIACSKHFYTKSGEYGYEDVVKSAINRGINLNIRNPKDGKTALMYALNNRDSAVSANLLIDAGADIDIEDHRGRIALFDSVSNSCCYDAIVTRTLDINHQDHYGTTALMIAAYRMDKAIINDLLDRHADVHLRNNVGQNAYDIAQKYMDDHIQIAIETRSDDAEYSKSKNITTSKDVLNAQKHNHMVREMVRKLKCAVDGEPYVETKFKKTFFNTGKAN